jgi:hypothetical protein
LFNIRVGLPYVSGFWFLHQFLLLQLLVTELLIISSDENAAAVEILSRFHL